MLHIYLVVFISLAGIIASASESPPAHYTVRLQSLALLAKNNIEKYSTSEFEAAGYKWYKKKGRKAGFSFSLYSSIHLSISLA